jgi:hypothetical protein
MDKESIFVLSSIPIAGPAASASLVLFAFSTTRKWTFNACLENVSPTVSANGDQAFTATFTSDGLITQV